MSLLDIHIAWAAGLFEGEGSWSLRTSWNVDRTREYKYGRAQLHTTDLDVLTRFAEIVGVGWIYAERPRENRMGGLEAKLVWRWSVQDQEDFRTFSNLIEPWLGERRLARLNEIRETIALSPIDYQVSATCHARVMRRVI